MDSFFKKLHELLETGQHAELAVIVGAKGSAPRGPGARMLVDKNGRVDGTVGGGRVEFRCMELSVEALAEGNSFVKDFELSRADAEDIGMICGGANRILFVYLEANGKNREFAACAARCVREGTPCWLAYALSASGVAQVGLYGKAGWLAGADIENMAALQRGQPVLQQEAGQLLFCDPLVVPGRALVFGGGHLARDLVPLLAKIDFSSVVYDDRADFANAETFPDAQAVIADSFEDLARHVQVQPEDFVVVITRGHAADFTVLEQVLRLPTRYVGVVGSRAKTAAVNKRLADAGIAQADIARIHTPIGLPILAKTPAEIAVSIAAQLIQVRAEAREAQA